jgi:hypothetical protein
MSHEFESLEYVGADYALLKLSPAVQNENGEFVFSDGSFVSIWFLSGTYHAFDPMGNSLKTWSFQQC